MKDRWFFFNLKKKLEMAVPPRMTFERRIWWRFFTAGVLSGCAADYCHLQRAWVNTGELKGVVSRSPPFGAFFQVDKLPRNVACRYFRPPFCRLSACSCVYLISYSSAPPPPSSSSRRRRSRPPQAKVTVASLNTRRPYIPRLSVDFRHKSPRWDLWVFGCQFDRVVSDVVVVVGIGSDVYRRPTWIEPEPSPPGGTRCFCLDWQRTMNAPQETATTPSFFFPPEPHPPRHAGIERHTQSRKKSFITRLRIQRGNNGGRRNLVARRMIANRRDNGRRCSDMQMNSGLVSRLSAARRNVLMIGRRFHLDGNVEDCGEKGLRFRLGRFGLWIRVVRAK